MLKSGRLFIGQQALEFVCGRKLNACDVPKLMGKVARVQGQAALLNIIFQAPGGQVGCWYIQANGVRFSGRHASNARSVLI